jgi:ureidoglycolate lyase
VVRGLIGTATIAVPTFPISPASFALFGDVIEARPDGTRFGSDDARLNLSLGTPRFYVMRLPRRGLTFDRITRHQRVTQCLAAVGDRPWYLAVAPPNDLTATQAEPTREAIVGFRIPGDVAIKLHVGTWHAGPLFESDEMCFFNLELSDTNEIDHQSSLLAQRFGAPFALESVG